MPTAGRDSGDDGTERGASQGGVDGEGGVGWDEEVNGGVVVKEAGSTDRWCCCCGPLLMSTVVVGWLCGKCCDVLRERCCSC